MREKVVQIRTEDMDELKKNIHDVVYISSNGDETITEYISDLYKELGAPAITCMLAPDRITKKRLINMGYDRSLSESQIMYNMGYWRIYDSGQTQYIWNNNL